MGVTKGLVGKKFPGLLIFTGKKKKQIPLKINSIIKNLNKSFKKVRVKRNFIKISI